MGGTPARWPSEHATFVPAVDPNSCDFPAARHVRPGGQASRCRIPEPRTMTEVDHVASRAEARFAEKSRNKVTISARG